MPLKNSDTKLLPKSAHFVGIGGVGMSALAQMLQWQGVIVSGSDRAIDNPENSPIFSPLKAQGIRLYPQDGSYINDSIPDFLVYSTAIEDDNLDFTILNSKIKRGVTPKKVHRSEMLAQAITALKSSTIAISGSCGKTTVTAWLTEVLFLCGLDPLMIGGGLSNRFINNEIVGNFHPGKGVYSIFEADESDKSLLKYTPDYALILNIGTDHYPKEELKILFKDFLKKVKKGVVVSDEVYDFLGDESFLDLKVAIFADRSKEIKVDKCKIKTKNYDYIDINSCTKNSLGSDITINKNHNMSLPFPGAHSALNSAAIIAMCEMIGIPISQTIEKIPQFKGVWRRFDYAGTTQSGAKVYDDYAHNVEKIISSINTAREVSKGKVIVLFQPHGYGPLGFMREPLFTALEENLSNKDIFALLPVYYAGGTSSFTPKSEDVINEYKSKGLSQYIYYNSREIVINNIDSISSKNDVIIVMGARDNSLSTFAQKLTC